jgi:hypothetical protein
VRSLTLLSLADPSAPFAALNSRPRSGRSAQRALPDCLEREALMRRAKNLLVAFMPFKLHLHNLALEFVQPWIQSY